MNNQQKIEVAWYLKNGAYPAERLIPDKDGLKYVIGDYSWNLKYPENREYVEGLMPIVRFQESAMIPLRKKQTKRTTRMI